MTQPSSIAFSVMAATGLFIAGSASAQPARWAVIQQPGGYSVARVTAQGLVTGMGVTCERGVPVIAVSLRGVPSRNPARAVIAVDGTPFPIGLVRNLSTNVWVAGLRDSRLLDAMAGGSAAQVSVEGVAYGATSLAGTREAFGAALSGCYRVPAQTAATAPVRAPLPSAPPPSALAAWKNFACSRCRATDIPQFKPSPYSAENLGTEADIFIAGDINGDAIPDFAFVRADRGTMDTVFVVSTGTSYRAYEGFGGRDAISYAKRCGSRDVFVVGSGHVWGWSGGKVAHLGTEDAMRCPTSTQALTQVSTPLPYDIVVTIAFTPWAAQYVAQRPQRLVISALYFGEPIPSRQRAVDREEGTITIGEHSITVPARAATVRLTGATINRQRLSWITRLDVEVAAMMEVWEERWKVECTPTADSVSGPLSTVQAHGVTITCDRAPQY